MAKGGVEAMRVGHDSMGMFVLRGVREAINQRLIQFVRHLRNRLLPRKILWLHIDVAYGKHKHGSSLEYVPIGSDEIHVSLNV